MEYGWYTSTSGVKTELFEHLFIIHTGWISLLIAMVNKPPVSSIRVPVLLTWILHMSSSGSCKMHDIYYSIYNL